MLENRINYANKTRLMIMIKYSRINTNEKKTKIILFLF